MPETAITIQTRCPRCDGLMAADYDEPHCLRCGYVDYEPIPGVPEPRTRHLPEGARRGKEGQFVKTEHPLVLRYGGSIHNSSLTDKTIAVTVGGIEGHLVYNIDCPYCGSTMDARPWIAKGKRGRFLKFRCPSRHIIFITLYGEELVSWK